MDALSRHDVTAMLRLFAAAIPLPQLRRSIYLAKGADQYLRQLLRFPGLQGHEQLWGVKDGTWSLLAAAHTKALPGRSHLNNCAVDPAHQRRGFGSWMLDHWEATAMTQGAKRLSLDVAEENVQARRLYVRRGFREESATHEFLLPRLSRVLKGRDLLLPDWPQAQAHFDAFGFGRFHVQVGDAQHPVDLLPHHFRVSTNDELVLAALARMDQDREILLRSPDPRHPDSWRPVGTIIRMIKDLE